MSRVMLKKRWVPILISSTVGLFLFIGIILVIWGTSLNKTINTRLAGKRWAAPTEFYSAPERFIKGQVKANETIASTLERLEFRHVMVDRALRAGEYSSFNSDVCR